MATDLTPAQRAVATSLALDLSADPGAGARPLPLSVGGWVRHPLQLEAADLVAMEWIAVADFDVICTLDGAHGRLPRIRAVRLGDLIERAAPDFQQRTDFKRVAIIAESVEGYRALFSWAEVFNSPLASGIVVAFDFTGLALPPDSGPFALLARNDLATGPRFVRRLQRITLHKVW
jgi:hypothetical protein